MTANTASALHLHVPSGLFVIPVGGHGSKHRHYCHCALAGARWPAAHHQIGRLRCHPVAIATLPSTMLACARWPAARHTKSKAILSRRHYSPAIDVTAIAATLLIVQVPGGLLPVIELDGNVVTESSVIMSLLEDEFGPDKGFKALMPARGTPERARADALMRLEREWWGGAWVMRGHGAARLSYQQGGHQRGPGLMR